MTLLAAILTWLLIVLLAVVTVLLLLPLRLRIHAQTVPAPRLRIYAQPLGGAVPELLFHDSAAGTSQRRPGWVVPHAKPAKRGPVNWRNLLTAGADLVRDVLGCVDVEQVIADFDIGLADPADTGALYGLLSPIVYARPWPSGAEINVRPDFTRQRVEGELFARCRVVLLRLMPPVARFAWRMIRSRK